jgi:hypothetical protein
MRRLYQLFFLHLPTTRYKNIQLLRNETASCYLALINDITTMCPQSSGNTFMIDSLEENNFKIVFMLF